MRGVWRTDRQAVMRRTPMTRLIRDNAGSMVKMCQCRVRRCGSGEFR